MKIEVGKEYVTRREDREVRIYCVDGGGGWPVHGAVKDSQGEWSCGTWTLEGRKNGGNYEHPLDLLEKKRKVTKIAVVRKSDGDSVGLFELAPAWACSDKYAIQAIEFEL